MLLASNKIKGNNDKDITKVRVSTSESKSGEDRISLMNLESDCSRIKFMTLKVGSLNEVEEIKMTVYLNQIRDH